MKEKMNHHRTISWDDIFGLAYSTQQFEKHKQINVEEKTFEALSDEMKTEQSADASVSPIASETPKKDDAPEKEVQNDSGNSETETSNSDDSMGSSTEDSTESNDDTTDDNASDKGGEGENSGEDIEAEEPISSSPDPELPKGANPNRTLNGKLKLSQEIHNLINEMESALETFEQISLKTPVVVKLRELKESTELLLDTVASVPIEDTMVRYELFVRSFRELVVKHLKIN